jgi:formate/nitrite transporter FocA (FNT family)
MKRRQTCCLAVLVLIGLTSATVAKARTDDPFIVLAAGVLTPAFLVCIAIIIALAIDPFRRKLAMYRTRRSTSTARR